MNNNHLELQRRYDQLVAKVKLMLDTQQAYFKSGKDINLLKKSKAIESEIKEIVNPKPIKQSVIDWLGQ